MAMADYRLVLALLLAAAASVRGCGECEDGAADAAAAEEEEPLLGLLDYILLALIAAACVWWFFLRDRESDKIPEVRQCNGTNPSPQYYLTHHLSSVRDKTDGGERD